MNIEHAVLHALFTLAKNDRHATVLRVVEATGSSRTEVDAALASLDRKAMVDKERVRLTLIGLGAAMHLGAPRARRAAAAKKAA